MRNRQVARVLLRKRRQLAPRFSIVGRDAAKPEDFSGVTVLVSTPKDVNPYHTLWQRCEIDIREAAWDMEFLRQREDITRRIMEMFSISPQQIGDISNGGHSNIERKTTG